MADDSTESSPFTAVIQFFLVPLAIVGVSIGLFLFFGYLTGDQTSLEEHLNQVRTASHPKRKQAAYELSRRVVADPQAARESGITPLVIRTFEESEPNDPYRRYLVSVMGAIGDASAVPTLLPVLDDDEAETRGLAAWALGVLDDSRAVLPLVERLKREQDAELRSVMVLALGQIGDPRAVPQLKVSLEDTTPAVSWQAAFALAQCADSSANPLLRRLLTSDEVAGVRGILNTQVTQVRLNAIKALQLVAEPQDHALFEQLAKSDADIKVQRLAFDALAQLDAR